MSADTRTPWQITTAVWRALFLREITHRLQRERMAWFWMIVEPAAIIGFMASLRYFSGTSGTMMGAEYVPWVIVGLLGFFLFRENWVRSLSVIGPSKTLFLHKPILPIDLVLIRCAIEGLLKTVIFALFIGVGVFFGLKLMPHDVLGVLYAWGVLWLLGIAFGLTYSVINEFIPEIGKLVSVTSLPLMILSGGLIPIALLPHSVQEWFWLNPIAHGIELLRWSFFEHYHQSHYVSELYLWQWVLGMSLLGLLLNVRYRYELKAQ